MPAAAAAATAAVHIRVIVHHVFLEQMTIGGRGCSRSCTAGSDARMLSAGRHRHGLDVLRHSKRRQSVRDARFVEHLEHARFSTLVSHGGQYQT
jgi:hypothetical protein